MLSDVLDWVPALGPVLVFAVLLYLPGTLVLWGAGMRLGRAALFAPVASTALVGGGGVLLSTLSVRWSALSFVALTVFASVAAVAGRWAVQRRRFHLPLPRPTLDYRSALWVAGGLALNAVAVAWLYIRPTGSAEAVAYEYDTIWHFAVIRWITETGDASSLHTGLVDGTAGNHFYPAAWHALVSLTAELSGASLAAAVHGSILLTLLVVWPLGLMWLYRTLFGRSPIGLFVASAAAFLPAVYPVGFFAFGLLYPNFFSYALAPACLVVLITLLRAIGARSWAGVRPEAFATVLGALCIPVAILFAQPNSAFTLLVILLPLVYLTIWRLFGRAALPRAGRWAAPAAVAAFTIVLTIAWVVLHDSSFLSRTVAVDAWNKYQSRSQAIGEWLFFGNGTEGQLVLGALVIAGLVVSFVTRTERWWAVGYGLLGALFVVAAGIEGGPGSLRSYLVGFWYADATRLAAAGAIMAIPLIAFAAVRGAARLEPVMVRATPRAGVGSLLVATVVVGAFAFTLSERALQQRAGALSEKAFIGEAQWVSPSEKAFMDRVAVTVGDATVANDPFDGSAMAYGLNGIDVLFPALPGNWMGVPTADQLAVMGGLNRVADDPAVCHAAAALGVEYVMRLEVGARGMFGYVPEMFAGVRVGPTTPGFELVDAEGPLALYRLASCAA